MDGAAFTQPYVSSKTANQKISRIGTESCQQSLDT